MTSTPDPQALAGPLAGALAGDLGGYLRGYLRRLGFVEPPACSVDSLQALHRAHLAALPYDNLEIMLGRPPAVGASATLHRIATVGRAGYCFHHNGAFGALLEALGYDVGWRHGQVFTAEEELTNVELNHLVLAVSGLPTSANPGGVWWPDVGLGDAFLDPLPVVAHTVGQGGFSYRLDEVADGAWRFWHDRRCSFTGLVVSDRPRDIDPAAIQAAHRRLSTPPEGRFTRLLIVERRHDAGLSAVRGCVLVRDDGVSCAETDLASYDVWRAALVDEVNLAVGDLPEGELVALWERSWAAHQAWDAAGRP